MMVIQFYSVVNLNFLERMDFLVLLVRHETNVSLICLRRAKNVSI